MRTTPGKRAAEPGTNGAGVEAASGPIRGEDALEAEEEPTEEETVGRLFASLPAGSQVHVYRTSPNWAEGHLQTIIIEPGAAMDNTRIDEISRYWGGGTYRFRPIVRGQFLKGSRSLRIDGPTLWNGQPHPHDPRRRVVEVGQAYEHRERDYQRQPQQQMQVLAGPGQSRQDAQLSGLMAQMFERLDVRLGALELAVRTPPAALSNPVDPNQTILNSLRLAKEIGTYFTGGHLDDDDDEEEEEKPGVHALLEKLLARKLDEYGEGDNKPKPAPTSAEAPGKARLIRAPRAAPRRTETSPEPGRASTPNPEPTGAGDMLAMFSAMPAADQARLFKSVGDSLSPSVVAELAKLMGASPDDGAAEDFEDSDEPTD